MMFKDKCIMITGGTGSLGNALVNRLLTGERGIPNKIIIFSRDEAKQHSMRMSFQHRHTATDELIYQDSVQVLQFRIGDVRDYKSVAAALRDVDIVINAAALKQVPTCEYFPSEAVMTNILGAENIVRAIKEHFLPVEAVVGISTDKACKPVNVMGMTKAIQERIFIQANLNYPKTRFICVRYGNVIASRNSVIPLFLEQIENGRSLSLTSPEMTRFLISLDQVVDTIFTCVEESSPGETYIPITPAAKILDVAKALIGKREVEIVITGVRPGEKMHETLVSEEESFRTVMRGNHYVILPILPELRQKNLDLEPLKLEFSSNANTISLPELIKLLHQHQFLSNEPG